MRKIINRFFKLAKNEYILIAGILVFALLVRLYKVTNPIADWHSWRQADTASVSRIYLEEGIDLLYPRYHDISTIQTGMFNPEGYRFVEFPIFNAANALLAKNLPMLSLEVWGRLISIFAAVVSTYLLYRIGKHFFGKWGGLLAAFFYAFIPFNIYFTRVILPEPLSITFGLAFLWFFIKFIDEEKKWQLYLSGVFMAIAMLIKPFVFFFTAPAAYLAVKKYGFKRMVKDPKILIPFLIFINIAFIPFFTWRVWMNQYLEGIPKFWWAFNEDGIRFKPAFWKWIFTERLSKLILGGLGIVPFVFGILDTKRKKYPLFNHFFLLGMFLYVSTFATANVRHDYYQTFVIPAVALTLAQGTLVLWNTKKFNNFLARGILVFSVGVMLISAAVDIRPFYQINHPEIITAGEAVDKLTPKDALVIASYGGDTAFLYHTKRKGWPVVDTSIDKLIERGADYFVSVNFGDPDVAMLKERFEVVEETSQYVIINLHEGKN